MVAKANAKSCSICIVKVLLGISLACVLFGCFNAYERLYLGQWQSAGDLEVPGPFDSKALGFRMMQISLGGGSEIKPGSLVHVSVRNQTFPICGPSNTQYPCMPQKDSVHDLWFWVGREKFDRGLGSYSLRAAFIGVREGGVASVEVRRGVTLGLPTRAFLLPYALFPGTTRYSQYDTDYVDMGGNEDRQYEIKILRVCEGRLLRKVAVLKQWGYEPHVWAGSPGYPFARAGNLEWIAVEAQCESPTERIRFEKGPAYDLREGSLDGNWPYSYKSAVESGRVEGE